jgi:hypothetical protein
MTKKTKWKKVPKRAAQVAYCPDYDPPGWYLREFHSSGHMKHFLAGNKKGWSPPSETGPFEREEEAMVA